ncbi:hypothetical protein M3231_06815 [Neobacillus mesonae]|nr:hypothetical protein [Neobacillus mesonae]
MRTMQTVNGNEQVNCKNLSQTAIQEGLELYFHLYDVKHNTEEAGLKKRYKLEQETCLVEFSGETRLEANADLFNIALDLFDHFDIPVRFRWNLKNGTSSTQYEAEANELIDRMGLEYFTLPESETWIQKEECEDSAYVFVDEDSGRLLARGMFSLNLPSPAANLRFDLDAVEMVIEEMKKKEEASQKTAQVLVCASSADLSDAASRAAYEIGCAGIQASCLIETAIAELVNGSGEMYIIEINNNPTETELISVNFFNPRERTHTPMVLDQGIHILTQLLL